MSDERYEHGMKVRRSVLGDFHVDQAAAKLDSDFNGRDWSLYSPYVDSRYKSTEQFAKLRLVVETAREV